MKHSTKGILCLGLVLLLVMPVMTGCSTKKITSEALENDTASGDVAKDESTSYILEVIHTKVDNSKLKVNRLSDLHSENEDAFLVDVISSQQVYEVKGRDDVYIAYVDSKAVNDVSGKLVDYAFYPDGRTDGMKYDTEKGIVYIPKDLYDDAMDDGRNPGIQLMMAVDAE